MGDSNAVVSGLYDQKLRKLAQQRELFNRFNARLTEPGGLNEVSRKTCKNLEAAVVASRQPGYFTYYEAPQDMQRVVQKGELRSLRKQMDDLQRELNQLDVEIEQATRQARAQTEQGFNESFSSAGQVSNIRQWFGRYGKPKPYPEGLTTTFNGSAKVYGKTNHHSAFRTQATIMKPGHATK